VDACAVYQRQEKAIAMRTQPREGVYRCPVSAVNAYRTPIDDKHTVTINRYGKRMHPDAA